MFSYWQPCFMTSWNSSHCQLEFLLCFLSCLFKYVYLYFLTVDRNPEIVLREWWARRDTPIQKADPVGAIPLDWLVPPLLKLWLGREPEDKTLRLRAFLSCLNSDSPSMTKTPYVPRHALILCCVVRSVAQAVIGSVGSGPRFKKGCDQSS